MKLVITTTLYQNSHVGYNDDMLTCIFENGKKASLRHLVVDILVLKDKQILLVKRAPHLSNPGKYGLIGGFVDRDETTSQAAVREIFEETGYRARVTRLFRIVDSPRRKNEDRQNVSFVFIAEALKKEGEPDSESTEVRWFSLTKLPPVTDFAFDHYENIELYMRYLKKPFPLPLFHL